MGGIFKAYDIRGSYPDELDEVTARKIGAGFVALLKAQRIVVGHDMRLSASALASCADLMHPQALVIDCPLYAQSSNFAPTRERKIPTKIRKDD
jgi:hypothetical protein